MVDAKHFTTCRLPKHEVDTTEGYRCCARASAALLIVSSCTDVPDSVHDYADRRGVTILTAGEDLEADVEDYFDDLRKGWNGCGGVDNEEDGDADEEEHPRGGVPVWRLLNRWFSR